MTAANVEPFTPPKVAGPSPPCTPVNTPVKTPGSPPCNEEGCDCCDGTTGQRIHPRLTAEQVAYGQYLDWMLSQHGYKIDKPLPAGYKPDAESARRFYGK